MKPYRIAVVVLALLGLSGCVSIPTSGPVVVSSQTGHTAEPQIDVRPRPPAADASALDVVNGFLVAMADSGGDFAIARQYLTSEASAAWRPEHGAQVYSSATLPHESSQGITMDGTTVGSLDSRGSYLAHRQQLHHSFDVIKVGGQWRISNPPDGLLLSSALFNNNYTAATLYYFEPTLNSLVPDVVYMPRQQLTAATLVRALLAGPTDWIAPAVRTALPDGLALGTAGVASSAAGTVTISFNQAIATLPNDDARTHLAAQLLLTLRRNLPTTNGLVLLNETVPVALPDSTGGVWPLANASAFDPLGQRTIPDLFGVQDDRLGRIADSQAATQFTPLNGTIGKSGYGIGSFAVALDGSQAAIVTNDHSTLVVGPLNGTDAPVTLLNESGLLRPQYSRVGELWAMSTNGATTQVHRYSGTQSLGVSAPGLAGIAVDAFRISPDGTRMIVLGRRDDAPVLGMVQIRRNGADVTVDGWRPLDTSGDGSGPNGIVAVGWRSDTQLLLLGSDRESGAVNPYEFDLDCQTITRDAASLDSKVLATMPFGRFSAAVLTTDGYVLRRSDNSRWPVLEQTAKLSTIGYPG